MLKIYVGKKFIKTTPPKDVTLFFVTFETKLDLDTFERRHKKYLIFLKDTIYNKENLKGDELKNKIDTIKKAINDDTLLDENFQVPLGGIYSEKRRKEKQYEFRKDLANEKSLRNLKK